VPDLSLFTTCKILFTSRLRSAFPTPIFISPQNARFLVCIFSLAVSACLILIDSYVIYIVTYMRSYLNSFFNMAKSAVISLLSALMSWTIAADYAVSLLAISSFSPATLLCISSTPFAYTCSFSSSLLSHLIYKHNYSSLTYASCWLIYCFRVDYYSASFMSNDYLCLHLAWCFASFYYCTVIICLY